MDERKPIADDIIPVVQSWIDEVGVEAAFKIVGKLLLYSGPRESIRKALPFLDRNHVRATSLLQDGRYTLIDDTFIGINLKKYAVHGIYKYFLKVYGQEKINDQLVADIHSNAVMAFASEAFMYAAKGDVETLVSGADLNGVFYTKELNAILRNKNITSINGVPIERFRDVYFSGDRDAKYQTFRKICQSEAALARRDMASAPTEEDKEKGQTNYQTSRKYFIMERKETIDAEKKLKNTDYPNIEIPPPYTRQPGISHPNLMGLRAH